LYEHVNVFRKPPVLPIEIIFRNTEPDRPVGEEVGCGLERRWIAGRSMVLFATTPRPASHSKCTGASSPEIKLTEHFNW